MRTTIPDEDGWYWCYDSEREEWQMALVNNRREIVRWFDDEGSTFLERFSRIRDGLEWHGPFSCPGGDFGETTVVLAKQLREEAEQEGKAVRLVHIDFRHCRDELHGISITTTELVPRELALKVSDVFDAARKANA